MGFSVQQAFSYWLDIDSTFRLAVGKAKATHDGGKYARKYYENKSKAYKSVKPSSRSSSRSKTSARAARSARADQGDHAEDQ
jgi:hypothetical protein